MTISGQYREISQNFGQLISQFQKTWRDNGEAWITKNDEERFSVESGLGGFFTTPSVERIQKAYDDTVQFLEQYGRNFEPSVSHDLYLLRKLEVAFYRADTRSAKLNRVSLITKIGSILGDNYTQSTSRLKEAFPMNRLYYRINDYKECDFIIFAGPGCTPIPIIKKYLVSRHAAWNKFLTPQSKPQSTPTSQIILPDIDANTLITIINIIRSHQIMYYPKTMDGLLNVERLANQLNESGIASKCRKLMEQNMLQVKKRRLDTQKTCQLKQKNNPIDRLWLKRLKTLTSKDISTLLNQDELPLDEYGILCLLERWGREIVKDDNEKLKSTLQPFLELIRFEHIPLADYIHGVMPMEWIPDYIRDRNLQIVYDTSSKKSTQSSLKPARKKVISEFTNDHTYAITGQLHSDFLSHSFTFDHSKFIFRLYQNSWKISYIRDPSSKLYRYFFSLKLRGNEKTLTSTLQSIKCFVGVRFSRSIKSPKVNGVIYRGRVDFTLKITPVIL